MRRMTHRLCPVLAAVVIIIAAATAEEASGPDWTNWQNSVQTIDRTSYYDANALLLFAGNTGIFAHDKTQLLGQYAGLRFPKGTTKSAIYCAGLLSCFSPTWTELAFES